MIREKRNKEKLASYYRKFMEDGVIDPNVHPWVAESWQRCRAMKLPHETMPKLNKLSREIGRSTRLNSSHIIPSRMPSSA